MANPEKVLWVVGYNNLEQFVSTAVQAKVTAVAIRTDNGMAAAILAFHKRGIKVYGWRWPSAQRVQAMQEAVNVVALLGAGLDGYFVDPEGAPGKPYDWDQAGLDVLAHDFCATIAAALGQRPFGVTSHYRARQVFPQLPWATFFEYSTVLLPQAYWRSTEGTIGQGQPAANYTASLAAWSAAGGDADRIVPMAGELGVSSAAEIDAYAAQARASGIGDRHFYGYANTIAPAVWDAVARA